MMLNESLFLRYISTFLEKKQKYKLKTAPINTFIFAMDHMCMYNVEGAACSDEPTEKQHQLTVPLSSMGDFSSLTVSSHSCFL